MSSATPFAGSVGIGAGISYVLGGLIMIYSTVKGGMKAACKAE